MKNRFFGREEFECEKKSRFNGRRTIAGMSVYIFDHLGKCRKSGESILAHLPDGAGSSASRSLFVAYRWALNVVSEMAVLAKMLLGAR
jgi:hypothetical protein